jgi:NAD(P)-dependent dehydrogenase (short-subunit alcohol dehydrogenase family)
MPNRWRLPSSFENESVGVPRWKWSNGIASNSTPPPCHEWRGFPARSATMNLEGKTILVTGSTDGVGRVVAQKLANSGAHIVVHGRNQDRGERLVDSIQTAQRVAATFYRADFAALAEVRRLADEIHQNFSRIDVLINNAGIGSGGRDAPRQMSIDGYELRFAVNYLSGFLLTRLLLPLLIKSRPARIINIASLGQHPIDFNDLMLTHGYSGSRAYAQSKLAQIMFTFDLAQELEVSNVTANCLHPATYMNTTMVRDAGVTPISTTEEGATAILNLAVAAPLDRQTGQFFNGLSPSRANPQAYDLHAREQLRSLSLKLTGLA